MSSPPSRPPAVTSSPGSPTVTSAPATGRTAVEGTTWLLVRAVVDGTTYRSPQHPGSAVFGSYTMQFAKGQVEANDGCNSIGGPASVDKESLTISGDLWSTDVGCPATPLRDAYNRMLGHKAQLHWTLSGDRLTLTASNGDTFEYEPWPTGFPSDLAGEKHATTAQKTIDGVPFRIYSEPRSSGGDQCLVMEFNPPSGTPWEPVRACRDDLAKQYVVNPTDFATQRLPSGTGVLFSAVPNGTTSRIVYRPKAGGSTTEFALTPLPGTAFQAFYAFVDHLRTGDTVTFYDTKGNAYKDIWKVYW
ncbi:META domain-containing protein [Nakamurella lactea]|uniref:META domain-containing protein n=1 Tax=Nakamurella lactea TaxID=459515 RepID=UPI001376DAD3|nr:META domain-containing protein [Nakamurella lactea]